MTQDNDLSAANRYELWFDSGASSSHTLNGSTTNTFYDFSGKPPKIENTSTSEHTINFPIALGFGYLQINPVNGNLTIGGNVNLSSNQLQVYGDNGKTLSFTSGSVISGMNGAVAINQNSTVVYNSAHTYTGDTFINAGVLQFNSSASASSSTIRIGDTWDNKAAATLALASGATVNSTVNVRSGSSGTKTINSLATSGTATVSGNVYLDAAASATSASGGTLAFTGDTFDLKAQTLTVTGAGNTTISGSLQNSTGSGALTKTGSGTLTLSGTNTYDGPTAVDAGMLVVDGNQSGATGNVTVASGATLAGEGTVGGATTVSGTHAPGNGTAGDVGTQAFSNNLTYSSGSIFAWDLTSASTTNGFDKVTGATGKTFASSGAFRVITGLNFATDTFWDTTQTWTTIFSGFGNLTGWASTAAATVYNTSGTPLDVSSHGSFTINGITLTWTPIPELSNLLIGALLGAGMMRRKRKNV